MKILIGALGSLILLGFGLWPQQQQQKEKIEFGTMDRPLSAR